MSEALRTKKPKYIHWTNFQKMFWIQLASLTAILFAVGVGGHFFIRERVLIEIEQSLKQVTLLLHTSLQNQTVDKSWCHSQPMEQMYRISLIDNATGNAFCDSKVNLQDLPNLTDREEFQKALKEPGFVCVVRKSNVFQNESMYCAVHVANSGKVLRAGHTLSHLSNVLNKFYLLLALILVAIMLFMGLTLYLLNRRYLLKKVDDLVDRTTKNLKDEFVANVSHELKTPLTSIRGFAELMQLEAAPAAFQEPLAAILRSVDRMSFLVRDLLELSVLDSGILSLEIETVDLSIWMENFLQEMQPLLAEKNLVLKPSIEIKEAKFDPHRMHQVATNLVSNAIRYSPKNGSIHIRWLSQGNQVVFEVNDEGPGIPDAHKALIFDRFHRVEGARSRSKNQEGSGLGLSIVKRIIELHGGEISVENKPGAQFRCILSLN